jgi:hypothetical protein
VTHPFLVAPFDREGMEDRPSSLHEALLNPGST